MLNPFLSYYPYIHARIAFISIMHDIGLIMFVSYVQLDQRLTLHKLDPVLLYHFPQKQYFQLNENFLW